MILFWKKFGILVPIIFVAGGIGGQMLLKLANRDYGRWQSVNMFVPGILLLIVGVILDIKNKPNDFCHFRMIIWGGLSVVFGAVILYAG